LTPSDDDLGVGVEQEGTGGETPLAALYEADPSRGQAFMANAITGSAGPVISSALRSAAAAGGFV
jgi:hypothetical protein